MTVSPANYISNALKAVDDTIANCAIFQTLMGQTTAAGVQALGKWQEYRAAESVPYYRLVFNGGTDVERVIKGSKHSLAIEFYACWTIATQAAGGDTEIDTTMRALNAWGLFLEQLSANITDQSSSTYLMKAVRQYEAPQRTADDDDHPKCWDASILFSVEN